MSTACFDPRRKKCKCTASRIGDAIASLGYSSSGFYVKQLRGVVPEQPDNERMAEGRRLEPIVAEAFEAFTGKHAELWPFATYDPDPRFGASPDYMVEDGTLLEIKTTQRKDAFLAAMPIPIGHLLQMLGQCAVHTPGNWTSYYAAYHRDTHQFYMARVQFESDLWYSCIWPRVKAFMDFVESGNDPKRLRRSAQLKLAITNEVLDKIAVSGLFSEQ